MVYTLDIVLDGRRRIATSDGLDLGNLSTDSELRTAVAAWLEVAPAELAQHSILRLPTGRVLLRIPLKVRLARLAQRVIEQESRIRVALSHVVAGVLGHPRLRRGLVSVVGSLQSLAVGLGAVAGRLAGPWGGSLQALAAAARRLDDFLTATAGLFIALALAVSRRLRGPVEGMLAAWAEVRGALRDVMRDVGRLARTCLRRVRGAAARVGRLVLAPPLRCLRSAERAFLAAFLRLDRATVRATDAALRFLGRGLLGAWRGLVGAVETVLVPGTRLALTGLVVVERLCERLVDQLWPVLRPLGCGALALVRAWQRVCRLTVALVHESVLALVGPALRLASSLGTVVRTRVAGVSQRLRRRLAPWVRVAWGWVAGTVDRLVTGRTAEQRERDHRLRVLDSLLTTPHGNLRRLWPVHARLALEDPLFYVHLAAWYATTGSVRDHQEMFVIVLVLSPLPEHREVGLALLRRLPPYEVARVVDFIKRTARRTPPRSLRTEVERYLREREAQPGHFDGAVLAAREPLKRLYSTFHIRPSERAQAILFDNAPPADSRLHSLKELAHLRGQAGAQAELLRRTAIPYKVAASVLGPLTEELAEALVARMSPQEVINNVGALRRRGALEHPGVAAAVERKLTEARTHNRVSAYKADQAVAAAPEWGELLRQVTQEQILRRGSLKVSTALLVDASASMAESLEIGKRLASMLAAVAEAPLVVLGFNSRAWEIPAGESYAEWEESFRSVRAEGATSPGSAVAWLMQHDRMVEQLVIVTDQRENQRPRLAATLRLYRRRNPHLRVVFVTLPGAERSRGGTDELHRQVERLGLETNNHRFGGDYYSLPDLLPLLSAPTRVGMLTEILETPLPQR